MQSRSKAIIKRAIPESLMRLYRSARCTWHLVSSSERRSMVGFLRDRSFALSFGKRLKLLWRIQLISDTVYCPHTQTEMLRVITAVLAAPANVPGCIVEAGCCKGGSTAKISLAAHLSGRTLVVFDSFEGLPEIEEPTTKSLFEGKEVSFKKGGYAGSLEEVRGNIARYGYVESCRFVKGWFKDTMPGFRESVAVAYVDVDLASSTQDCLKYLYPLISPSGVLFSQDGHLPLVVNVFEDDAFWQREVRCQKPDIDGVGREKLIRITKFAD
jgi:O-methyltransferase